jgi:hypothetical protein
VAANPNVHPDPHPDREGKFAYVCPMRQGTPGECGWVSYGWDTKKGAAERGAQHQAEHETGEPIPELADSGIAGAVQGG